MQTAQAQNAIDRFITLDNGKRVKVFVDAEVSANASGGLYQNGVKALAAGDFVPGIYPATLSAFTSSLKREDLRRALR